MSRPGENAPPMDETQQALAMAREAQDATPLKPDRRPRREAFTKLLNPQQELTKATIRRRDEAQDVSLKRVLAYFALSAVAAQLAVADWFFLSYLTANHFDVPESVMVSWLSATVVEVIGIVAIIARNLFPNRSRRRSRRTRK